MGSIKDSAMKILVFTTQIHLLGGAEKLAVELVEGLNLHPGVQADLLVLGSEDVAGSADTKKRLLNKGVRSMLFLGRPHGTRGQAIFRYILKLRHILKFNNYDVVETSMLGPTVLTCWARLGLRTKLVSGIHEIYRRVYQKSWSYKFLRFSVKINRKVQFYAISEQAKQNWIDYAQIEPGRVRVIYNSIGADHFESIREELEIKGIPDIGKNDLKALFVGRLCKRKGLDTLINALGPILNEKKIHLFIVGWESIGPDIFFPDDKDILERILKQIANNAWDERIHFLGIRDDVPKIMNFVDVMVHPARDEGFGLVLAEALAAGLPIVATSVGGIPEVLANTDSVLVQPDDPVALRNAFLQILHRTSEEAALCRNKAQQRAEFFRPERRIADLLAMFRDLSTHR
jgi:glycosyltransferase involved in cell wall biosynthesis